MTVIDFDGNFRYYKRFYCLCLINTAFNYNGQMSHVSNYYLRQKRRYMFLPVFVRLSVSKITQKCMDWFGWYVACRQTSGHGRTNYLLSPIRIIVWMPEPDCFLQYRTGYGTLLRGILHWENPMYTSWRRAATASRGFKMVLFTEPSDNLCRR